MGNSQQSQADPSKIKTSETDTTWSLFVANTYLIPHFMVNKDNATCQHQDERAAALGRILMKEKPDIVLLQECWGAAQGSLENEICAKGKDSDNPIPDDPGYTVGEYCKSWYGLTVLDSVLQYANKRGGLYFAHRNATTLCVDNVLKPTGEIAEDRINASCSALDWRSYSTSKTKSKKGMVCIKYQKKYQSAISTTTANSSLLVFNTHLDPTNEDNVQLVQLRDLACFIHDMVSKEQQVGKPFSAVLVGDFNFTPSSSQYKSMFEIMQKEGVALQELLSESAKNTHTYDAKNPLAMWPGDGGRIDLIFAVKSIRSKNTNEEEKNLVPVEVVSEKVRSDVVVSDHYPFQVVLKC